MTNPIIPWMGGKSRLADKILPLFPKHTCYVEVFAGGAAMFFKKEPCKAEVLNDINGELVNLYRVVKHHLEEFVHQFNYALVSRQVFEWLKMTHPDTLTDIQRAARFYYLQRSTFGGKVDGQTFGTATTAPPKLRIGDIQTQINGAWNRLQSAFIEHLDWQKCIAKYDRPHTLFFCDPPYWATAGYGVDFGLDQYQAMADLARSIDGKMIITINDHPDMRKVFKGLKRKNVDITYTVGGSKTGASKAKELIIQSW